MRSIDYLWNAEDSVAFCVDGILRIQFNGSVVIVCQNRYWLGAGRERDLTQFQQRIYEGTRW